jgi:hypothetical protein
MVKWSFVRPGFQVTSDRLDRSFTVNSQKVIARINVPELTLGHLIGSQTIAPGILSGARGRSNTKSRILTHLP